MSETNGLRDVAILAIVLLGAGALLSPLLGGGFLTDDYHAIRITTFGPTWDETLDPDDPTEVVYFLSHPATREFQLYRPSVLFGYALNYRLAGCDPFWYQLVNIVLHLVGGTLVFLIGRRIFPNARSTDLGIATAFFLTSPLQLEVAAWTATRSDSISWMWGATALLVKLGRPERRLLPAVFAALALTGKESALVFFPALVLVDFLPPTPGPGGALVARVRRVLARGWPLAVVLVAYFAVRYALFQSLFETNAYAKKDFESFWSLELWERYGRSIRTLVTPVSSLAFGDAWYRTALMVLFGAGFTVAVGAGARALLRRPLGVSALVLFLFACPFLLAVMVNEIAWDLIHTRALYTPMAALAIVLVAGLTGPWRRAARIGAALLIVLACAVSYSGQKLYVDAHLGVEAALEEIREPLRELPPARKRRPVAILGYRPLIYMRGAFHLEGAIRPALKRPFLDSDFDPLQVAFDAPDPSQPDWYTPFRDVLAGSTDDLVTLAMGPADPESGIAEVALLHRGAQTSAAGGTIRLVSPTANAHLAFEPSRPESLAPRFAFAARGLAGARFRLEIYACHGPVVSFPVPDALLERRAGPDGDEEISFALPAVPPEVLATIGGEVLYGWTVSATGESGGVIASAGLRPLTVSRP